VNGPIAQSLRGFHYQLHVELLTCHHAITISNLLASGHFKTARLSSSLTDGIFRNVLLTSNLAGQRGEFHACLLIVLIMDHLSRCPDEIVVLIALTIDDLKQIHRFSFCCKKFHRVARSDALWVQLFARAWGSLFDGTQAQINQFRLHLERSVYCRISQASPMASAVTVLFTLTIRQPTHFRWLPRSDFSRWDSQ